jgi:hydroxyquinol 1,2-dioxygenase
MQRTKPSDDPAFPELTEDVVGRIAATTGARVRKVMELLIRHLHAFVRVEVWQTAPNQLYDVQDDAQPEGHLRASFRTDALGRFSFKSVSPVSYPIPDDGPAGRLLQMMGRHPFRPAHVHFMISATGHRTLITHLFISGDAYLDSDTVFGVKQSLIVTPEERDGLHRIVYHFGLEPFGQT